MRSVMGRRKIAIILICAAIGFLATFTQYVHTGYVGVVDGSNPLRVLRRGLHFRAPWQRVVFYPTRSGSVGITTVWHGPREEIRAEITLYMSVTADSVESLHKAYRGEYVQALVVPCINEFFNLHGAALVDWQSSSVVNKTDQDLVLYLNDALMPRGVSIFQAWLVFSHEDNGQPK